MRTVRIRHAGQASHGVVREGTVALLDRAPFDGGVETGVQLPLSEVELLVPTSPSKILCVGRNYRGHIQEMGYEVPAEPALFMKPQGTLLAAGGTVVLPPPSLSEQVQHEAELAVVIGRRARDIAPHEVVDHVHGYTVADDVSARDLQRRDTSLIRGKGFDTFCPLGPWIETEVDPSAGLSIRCLVNGQLRQDGDTRELVFDVPFLISYLSRFTTLEPGDVVLTGSPAGTGDLGHGDEVEITIEGIGTLRHGVRSSSASSHSRGHGNG